jgi:hypothetical protein
MPNRSNPVICFAQVIFTLMHISASFLAQA